MPSNTQYHAKPKILWLRERFAWMGQHSGYDQLCDVITRLQPGYHSSVWREHGKLPPRGYRRFLRYVLNRSHFGPPYDIYSAAAELAALQKSLFNKHHLVHITYVENNLGFLPKWKQHLSLKVIGTAHQPLGWWRLLHPAPDTVSALDALIVPASSQVSFFEQFLPGRVYFIRHGVDTNFFCPKVETKRSTSYSGSPRCVFAGRWLRDTDTLAKVVDAVIERNPKVGFDMVVPRHERHCSAFFRIARHKQVSWHAQISDQQLREIYQQATMLVLPLLDCTANNVLIEAMACGLPIISSDVGGLRDYTRDDFAELFPVGDVAGYTQAILRLGDYPEQQRKRGAAARLFAEENLTWKEIAAQTLAVYNEVVAM